MYTHITYSIFSSLHLSLLWAVFFICDLVEIVFFFFWIELVEFQLQFKETRVLLQFKKFYCDLMILVDFLELLLRFVIYCMSGGNHNCYC